MIKKYSSDNCSFVYRGSRFKNSNEIIVSAELKLSVGDSNEIKKKMEETLLQRKAKIPSFPSAGSFFKNYKLKNDIEKDALIQKFPDLSDKIRSGKIATGYLIEQCGLKGEKVGGAMIPEEHANFIVNSGGATAQDVMNLAGICKEKVKKRYGIDLEIEKRLIGL